MTPSIIPPPVETDFFASDEPDDLSPTDVDQIPTGDFVLAMSRFIPYKRIDLSISTAAKVGLPIVVAGSGDDEDRLRQIGADLGHDVRFVIRPSQHLLRELYRRAQLLLFPAYEDFGIVPVEAQACGTPVVGYAAGGALDSIEAGVTGELADEQTLESFTAATERALNGLVTDPDSPARCRARALSFSATNFRTRITDWTADHVN